MKLQIPLVLQICLIFSVSAQDASQIDDCYSVTDLLHQLEMDNVVGNYHLEEGWNMFGYSCNQAVDVSTVFAPIVEDVFLAKDVEGNVYLPTYSFDGIGVLLPNQGYLLKMHNAVSNFSLCPNFYDYEVFGCTDCRASNFNVWANVDDGSCDDSPIISDINDCIDMLSCSDSTSCNYSPYALDNSNCIYAQEGMTCDGDSLPYVGMLAHGGIIFYVDSTGEHGLVSSLESISGLGWGCMSMLLEGDFSWAIGTGMQNTYLINGTCASTNSAAYTCANTVINGYNDWYLPSLGELTELVQMVGPYSPYAEITNFTMPTHIWSSTQYGAYMAETIILENDGMTIQSLYKSNSISVRAVRSF